MKKIAIVAVLLMAFGIVAFAQQQPVRVPYLPHVSTVRDSDVFVCNKIDSMKVDSMQATCILYFKDLMTAIHAPHVSTHTSGQVMLWATGDTAKGVTIHWADTNTANTQYVDPSSGSTVQSNGRRQLIIGHAGTLASLTIKFPAGPVNGQIFDVSIDDVVTTLTLSAIGFTIKGTITTSASGAGSSWVFYNAIWHKRTP